MKSSDSFVAKIKKGTEDCIVYNQNTRVIVSNWTTQQDWTFNVSEELIFIYASNFHKLVTDFALNVPRDPFRDASILAQTVWEDPGHKFEKDMRSIPFIDKEMREHMYGVMPSHLAIQLIGFQRKSTNAHQLFVDYSKVKFGNLRGKS